jgi:hypothetical protein
MACDLEEIAEDIEDSLSSFNASVTGAESTSFSGNAFFVSEIVDTPSSKGSAIFIELENETNSSEVIILGVSLPNNLDGVPAGTYTHDIDNFATVVVSVTYSTTNSGYLFPADGKKTEIVLTKVEGNRVEGSFTANLKDTFTLDAQEVSITGSFVALGK